MVDGFLGSVGPFSVQLSSLNPLGVPEVLSSYGSTTIYPNPTSGVLNIDFGSYSKESILRVYDLPGNLLKEQVMRNMPATKFDISVLANGVYFVKVENENGIKTQKIILNR